MRVIAGEARGRKLISLDGLHTRPTTDRVKESMFNMLSMRMLDARVLDAFSGSGALGIEALSRGAASCVFLENDTKAMSVTQENLKTIGFLDRANMHLCDACQFIKSTKEQFDIIFLDPPYDANLYLPILSAIAEGNVLAEDGVIVAERRADTEPCAIDSLSIVKDKRYGKTAVTMYERTK